MTRRFSGRPWTRSPSGRFHQNMAPTLPSGPVALREADDARGRRVIDLPLVVAVVGAGIGEHDPGVRLDRGDVGVAVVVGEQGAAHVRRAATGGEEAAGGEDRVVVVVDVAAPAVRGPGAREELHRSLR